MKDKTKLLRDLLINNKFSYRLQTIDITIYLKRLNNIAIIIPLKQKQCNVNK